MVIMRNVQVKYALRHWREFIWEIVKNTVAWVSILLAFFSSFVCLISEENPLYQILINGMEYLLKNPWVLVCAILLIALAAAITHWPRVSATYHDYRTDIKVIIENCDLLQQKGLKVIHSVDTFDTALGTIISPRSLHGAFLKHCQQQGIDIDSLQQESLATLTSGTIDDSLPCNKMRYPLGTLCPITVNDDDFVLVSFSHLQADGSIQLTKQNYINFLMRLWRNLASPTIRQDEINIAVMGNRFVDLPAEFSTEQKIDIMIQTFFAASKEKSICRTLRICVHESNVQDIDFAHYPIVIEHIAKRPVLDL